MRTTAAVQQAHTSWDTVHSLYEADTAYIRQTIATVPSVHSDNAAPPIDQNQLKCHAFGHVDDKPATYSSYAALDKTKLADHRPGPIWELPERRLVVTRGGGVGARRRYAWRCRRLCFKMLSTQLIARQNVCSS